MASTRRPPDLNLQEFQVELFFFLRFSYSVINMVVLIVMTADDKGEENE